MPTLPNQTNILAATCTNLRSVYTIVGGTFTTGTFFTPTWTSVGSAYVCEAHQLGGTTWLGIGNSLGTATSLAVTSANSISGQTFTVEFSCKP